MTESEVCSYNCCGVDDGDGACCNLDDRNWIMGNDPQRAEEFLERLSDKVGRRVEMNEVFYSFEEGSSKFPERPMWQNKASYPALRVVEEHPRKPCIFYNSQLKICNVYDIRPHTCRTFKCDYLSWFSRQV